MQILLTSEEYQKLCAQANGQHLQQELVMHHEAMESTFNSITPRFCGDTARSHYHATLKKLRAEKGN